MRRAVAENVVNDLRDGKTSIALAGRRADVAAINAQAREVMREAGMLKSQDVKFETQKDEDGPVVVKNFAVGDRVITLETKSKAAKSDNGKAVKLDNGNIYTVIRASREPTSLKSRLTVSPSTCHSPATVSLIDSLRNSLTASLTTAPAKTAAATAN